MIKAKKRAPAAQPIDPAKLKGYVERIEAVETRLVEERDARADIYTEVKASGMKPKMVRRIIKERAKKDEDAAEAAELDAYRAALAMPGATYRSVAEKTGMPKSTLHRLVPRAKNGTRALTGLDTIARDASGNPLQCKNDGEVIETQDAAPAPPGNPQADATREVVFVTPTSNAGPEVGTIPETRSPAFRPSDSAPPEPVVPTGNEGRAGERVPVDAASTPPIDDLAIPGFLRRAVSNERTEA
jgi:uncharacterized protein (UPF0335 family)